MRDSVGAVSLAVVLLVPQFARGQHVVLSVPSADACLDGARLGDLVEQHARAEPLDPLLRVQVERSPSTGAVSFTVRRGASVVSVRRFDAPPADCGALHAMVALAIAMALDAASLEPAALQAPQPREPQRPTRAVAGRPPAEADLAFAGLFGVARELSFGGTLGVQVAVAETVDARLSCLASLPNRALLGGGTVDIALAAARLDLCEVRPIGRLRGRACAGALLGRAFGVGRGFEEPFSATALWIAAAGRLSLVAPLTRRWGIDAGIDLLVPLVRPVFVVLDSTGAEAASVAIPAWGVLVSVGPSLSFP